MAQELVINTWCDVCAADGQREPGEPVTVSIDGHPPRLLDLCERDRKTYVAPLAELLESLGRRVDGKPARRPVAPSAVTGSGDATCIICGHPAPNASALGGHLRLKHDATLGEVYGTTCPVCGEEKSGTHVARSHGMPGILPAFAWARANGDPFGVVAAREAAAAATFS